MSGVYQRNYILDCSADRLRLTVPMWRQSMILEALRKIRATWKVHAKKMDHETMLGLLRKEQIVRNELMFRMLQEGVPKTELHGLQEKLIGHRILEQAMDPS